MPLTYLGMWMIPQASLRVNQGTGHCDQPARIPHDAADSMLLSLVCAFAQAPISEASLTCLCVFSSRAELFSKAVSSTGGEE